MPFQPITLRNPGNIFEHLFHIPTHKNGYFPLTSALKLRYRENLGLCEVSKSMRQEAQRVFFRCNMFWFQNAKDCRNFLSKIGPERRRFCRSIGLHFRISRSEKVFSLVGSCEALRVLHLVIDGYAKGPLLETRSVKQLMKIRGLKQLSIVFGIEHSTPSYKDLTSLCEAAYKPREDSPVPNVTTRAKESRARLHL